MKAEILARRFGGFFTPYAGRTALDDSIRKNRSAKCCTLEDLNLTNVLKQKKCHPKKFLISIYYINKKVRFQTLVGIY